MLPIQHDHTMSFFQQLPAMDVVHSTCVAHTFRAYDIGRVQRKYTARIVVLVAAQLLDQGAALRFTNIAQRAVEV